MFARLLGFDEATEMDITDITEQLVARKKSPHKPYQNVSMQ